MKLFENMAAQTHLLIAGKSGSGKSVVINGILTTVINNSPDEAKLVLIDPKCVELVDYADLPHTIRYACEPDEMFKALEYAMDICTERFHEMQAKHVKKYDGARVYVVIDELADLMTTDAKRVTPLIQRISQIGRAAGVMLICATQHPLSDVLPTKIKVNFDGIVGLKTMKAQHSRNIIDMNGCESLPEHGKAYYITPKFQGIVNVPFAGDEAVKAAIDEAAAKYGAVKAIKAKREAAMEDALAHAAKVLEAMERNPRLARLFA